MGGRWVFKGDDMREYHRAIKDREGHPLVEATGLSRRVVAAPREMPRKAVDVLPFLAGNWKIEKEAVLPKPPPGAAPAVGYGTFEYVADGKFLRHCGGPGNEFGEPLVLFSYDPGTDSLRRWFFFSGGQTWGPIPGEWNPNTRTLLWMSRIGNDTQANIAFHFVDANTFTTYHYWQDADNKVVHKAHMTFIRIKDPVTPPRLPPDPKRPAEMRVLDRLVGDWRIEATVAGSPKVQARRVKAETILGGRFVDVIDDDEAKKTSDYVIVWYDAEMKRYRQWVFGGRGDTSELRGSWDDSTKTMTWTSQDGRTERRWVFKTDDLCEIRHIVKDPDGKVLSDLSGVSRRVLTANPDGR
jgi:hypothetical protein